MMKKHYVTLKILDNPSEEKRLGKGDSEFFFNAAFIWGLGAVQ